jgi:hypothetical protein
MDQKLAFLTQALAAPRGQFARHRHALNGPEIE